MKKAALIVIYVCIVVLIVPLITVKLCINKREKEKYVNVYIKDEDRVEKMEVSQYLKEVVSAEMPAEFALEALKAQAVACRTYLENRRGNNDASHKGGDICTDYTHCKAWIREADRKSAWGNKADEYWEKISRAVDETENVIITYKGSPISALFHSTSSGHTENAKDVWGNDVPYLVSVESEGCLHSPKYKSEYSCTADEFKTTILDNVENANPDSELFSDIKRSEAGGIITLKVLGAEIKGTTFRTIFDLRSTNVQLELMGDTVKMSVLGYGHGVGMSQYGAGYMAAQGSSYKDILHKYYTGVEIVEK